MAIDDFGKKIGGAKKDLWKERGLCIEDLLEFNAAERTKFIKKDNVWKKPDYEQMVTDGLPVRVAYFIKLVRDSLPTKPVLSYSDKSEEQINKKQDGFISFIGQIRDAAMALKTESDVRGFYQENVAPYITKQAYSRYVDVSPEAYGCITNKLLQCAGVAEKSFRDIDRDIKKKQFCYSEDDKILAPYEFYLYNEDKVKFKKDYHDRDMIELSVGFGKYFFYPEEKWMNQKEWDDNTYFVLKGRTICGRNFDSIDAAKKFILDMVKEKQKEAGGSEISSVSKKKPRKRAFVPKQLEHIERVGPDCRGETSVTGQDYLNAFGFRGGEFGNWMNEKDRQASLDFGYEAFIDLSRALNIAPEDLSLGGRLSIAFGARGSGSALAHYESLREVINLTKMKGAGSLAHEWGHALDDIIGKDLGVGGMMTERSHKKNVPESLRKLVDSLKWKEVFNDEAIKSQELDVKKYENRLRRDIEQFFSSGLTEEQVEKKEQLLCSLISSAKDSKDKFGMYIFSGTGYPEIDAISDFRKEIMGRVIPKDWRIQIAHDVNAIRSSMEKIGQSKVVKTDFYENSIKFDSLHSKTDHGYWQSTIEMFARAFSCYVSDKLAEKGMRSDYLSGHSEMSVSFFTDKNGDLQVLKAFPVGEERAQINKNFDLFFEELKEMQILHPLDNVPDVAALENWVIQETNTLNKRKVSLDERISDVKKNSSVKSDSGIQVEPKYNEDKKGQLEFVF